MKKIIVLFIGVIMFSGCAFKGIDSCGFDDEGEGCTPVGVNLQNAINRSEARVAGKSPDTAIQADYAEMDHSILRDEYARVAPKGDRPQLLSGSEVRLRIYPYSDGERFYDTRDVYVLVQRAGWSRGSLIYSPKGVVSLTTTPDELPETLTVTVSELNVRTGASVLFPVTDVIRKGAKVHPIQYRDGWYEIDSVTVNTVRHVQGRARFRKIKKPMNGWVRDRYLE